MNGKSWLKYFAQVIESERELRKQSGLGTSPKDSDWTSFMQGVMNTVADMMNCEVTHLRPKDKARSGEYLSIDAFFVDKEAFQNKAVDYDPFVLPRAIVELENSYNINKISYCLWKILCVRVPIRVLICYQSNSGKVKELRQHLEKVVQDGQLMKDDNGDLLVIIGDESVKNYKSYFDDFFSVFEWQNNKLEIITRRVLP